MGIICLQCGNKGFTNAFVYCVKCLNFAVHRYCLDVIPGTYDELVHWVCSDDCEGLGQNQSSIHNHDGMKKNDSLVVFRKNEHAPEDSPTTVDSVGFDESAKDHATIVLPSEQIKEAENKRDYLTRPMRLIVKGIPKKIKKKRRHKIKPTKKKDEHTRDNVVASSKEENKEEVQLKNENTLDNVVASCKEGNKEVQVKDYKGSKKRDKKRVSSKNSKKKKKRRKILVMLSEENVPENKLEDEKNFEEENHSPTKDNVKNVELENKDEIIPEYISNNLSISTAEPVAMPIWTGGFNICNEERVMLNGILAHVSILACTKVYDEALQFRPVLQLQMLPKNDVWPKSFETLEPRGDNIALYFFPSKTSERDFDRLVDKMMRNELALKATVNNVELLIFNSSELPLLYWKFQGKYYLWGVFRQKQSSPTNSHPCRAEPKDENSIKPNNTEKTSLTKTGRNGLSPRSPLNNLASNGSHS